MGNKLANTTELPISSAMFTQQCRNWTYRATGTPYVFYRRRDSGQPDKYSAAFVIGPHNCFEIFYGKVKEEEDRALRF